MIRSERRRGRTDKVRSTNNVPPVCVCARGMEENYPAAIQENLCFLPPMKLRFSGCSTRCCCPCKDFVVAELNLLLLLVEWSQRDLLLLIFGMPKRFTASCSFRYSDVQRDLLGKVD